MIPSTAWRKVVSTLSGFHGTVLLDPGKIISRLLPCCVGPPGGPLSPLKPLISLSVKEKMGPIHGSLAPLCLSISPKVGLRPQARPRVLRIPSPVPRFRKAQVHSHLNTQYRSLSAVPCVLKLINLFSATRFNYQARVKF